MNNLINIFNSFISVNLLKSHLKIVQILLIFRQKNSSIKYSTT